MAEANGADSYDGPRDPTESSAKALIDLLELELGDPFRAELEELLAAIAELETTKRELSDELETARAAYSAAPKNIIRPEQGGLTPEISEPQDPEVGSRRNAALRACLDQNGVILKFKKEISDAVWGREDLDMCGRAALIQSLHHDASPDEWGEHGPNFKRALSRLNEELFEGQIVYTNGQRQSGVYTVGPGESGINIELETPNGSDVPHVVVRANLTKGSVVSAGTGLSQHIVREDKRTVGSSVKLYGLTHIESKPQPIDFLDGDTWTLDPTAGTHFLLGEAAKEALRSTPVSPAVRIGLGMVAEQQGINLVEENVGYLEQCGFTREQLESLRRQVRDQICEALIGDKIVQRRNPDKSVLSDRSPGEDDPLPVVINLRAGDRTAMRQLAKLSGLERWEVEEDAERRIREMKQKVDDPETDPMLAAQVVAAEMRLESGTLLDFIFDPS